MPCIAIFCLPFCLNALLVSLLRVHKINEQDREKRGRREGEERERRGGRTKDTDMLFYLVQDGMTGGAARGAAGRGCRGALVFDLVVNNKTMHR